MSVGILIITHNNIGQALLDSAVEIIGTCPANVKAISITTRSDKESFIQLANKEALQLDSKDGILILTDLYGATPSNIASAITVNNSVVVTGVNLPMLIRVLNYYNLPLDDLSQKAVTGGHDGVLAYPANG